MKRSCPFFIFCMILLLNACSTDFDVIAPWKDVPVVYGLINQQDSVHYIKVSKAFLGEESAVIMAQNPDSLYYHEAEVHMDQIRNNEIVQTIEFTPITDIPKEDGFFTTENNIVYQSEEILNPTDMYNLRIFIPETGKLITSSTGLIKEIRFNNSFTAPQRKLSFTGGKTETIEWRSTPNARLYEITLVFHYLEVIDEDTTEYSISWPLPYKTTRTIYGGERMTCGVNGDNFYRFVAGKVPVKENAHRLAKKGSCDFIFTIGGEDLYQYINVNKPNNSMAQNAPNFSNIEGGVGLFSSRYYHTVYGKNLSDRTIDTLAYGLATKHLNFADSFNRYYAIDTK